MSNRNITADMLVGDIIANYPESIDALISVGMHCLGCPASQMESLSDACLVHSLDLDEVLAKVNGKSEPA